MKKSKYTVGIALLLALVMALSACSSTAAPPASTGASGGSDDTASSPAAVGTASTKDTMIMRMAADPGTVDLLTVSSFESTGLYSMVGSSLLTSERDEETGSYAWRVNDEYSLATGYDIADDEMSVTFHLREGVKFHNGDEFTAEDAIYSINRYNNSKYSFIDFENMEAISDYELFIPFTEVNASAVISLGGMVMCDKDIVEADPDNTANWAKDYIGTGAYYIDSWVDGDSVTLKAFDDYWAGKPLIDTIIVRFIAEATTAMMEMETGNIDVLDSPNWASVKAVDEGDYEGIIKHFSAIDRAAMHLGFNCSEGSPFADIRVREAVCYAIDRDALNYGAYEGVAETCTTFVSLVYEDVRDYGDSWPYIQDIEKAKQLMAEAGYPDGFDAVIINYGDANDILANQILANMLGEIGINLTIESYDTATWQSIMSEQTTGWDLWLRNYTSTGSFTKWISTTVPQNTHVSAENDPAFAELLALCDAALGTLDSSARAEIHEEIQDRWFSEWLYTYCINQRVLHILYADNLQGVERYGYYWYMLHAYFD